MALAPLPVKWTHLLLLHILRQRIAERVLTIADLRPQFGAEEICSNESDFEPKHAFWSKVVNRLKIMANLNPVAYKDTVKGKILLILGQENCEVEVEFSPGLVPESVRITCVRSPACHLPLQA